MKLSIIIPAREEERAIAGTIAQFKDLLTIPHEIIVSDGRSKDRTVAVARETAHVVVVFDGTKHTAGIARNDGAKVAQGEFLAFVDSGVTVPDPQTFFSRALAHFADPAVMGVCGPQHALPAVETWADRLSFGYLNAVIRLQNNVLHKGEANGKFMLVRHSAFTTVQGFREDLVTREDGDFFYRLSRVGRTVYDPSLHIFHEARRAHTIGWARLWYIWTVNTIYFGLFNKSLEDDWTPIR
jgi:glycosyltransferase involved in cell wall biosynthesis